MKKKFVLSGYFGFKNFGDEAILSVIVSKLQSDGHDITVISSDTDYTKTLYNNVSAVKTFDFKNIIKVIYKSDVLVSGGGSLLQDVTSLKSLLYYLFIIFIGLLSGKKVIIYAQGIGPINSVFGTFLAKLLLKQCSYISVRDKKSYELLKSWGINSDLLCDPIFSVKIPTYPKTKTVAIQLRNCKGMNNDFLDRLADIVCKNFRDYEIEIYSFQDSIDLEVCKYFEKNINMLDPGIKTSLYSGLTNNEIIEKISKVQYLISMRFHAIIVGLLSEVKILAINYDIKVEKLAKEFDLPLIDLKKEFGDKFSLLKNQNTQTATAKVLNMNFDWSGFENAVK